MPVLLQLWNSAEPPAPEERLGKERSFSARSFCARSFSSPGSGHGRPYVHVMDVHTQIPVFQGFEGLPEAFDPNEPWMFEGHPARTLCFWTAFSQDPILTPTPNPRAPYKDFCLQPGLKCKFLLRRSWSGQKLLTLQFSGLPLSCQGESGFVTEDFLEMGGILFREYCFGREYSLSSWANSVSSAKNSVSLL